MTSPTGPTSLDLERTALANERTLLAYVRTSVSLAALGIVTLHFLATPSGRIFGILALIFAATLFTTGFFRFRGEQNRLRNA